MRAAGKRPRRGIGVGRRAAARRIFFVRDGIGVIRKRYNRQKRTTAGGAVRTAATMVAATVTPRPERRARGAPPRTVRIGTGRVFRDRIEPASNSAEKGDIVMVIEC